MEYPIGTKYLSPGKRTDICTVIDVHKTYNLAGELVKIRYVSIHDFCGQTVTNRDEVATTIARGLINDNPGG